MQVLNQTHRYKHKIYTLTPAILKPVPHNQKITVHMQVIQVDGGLLSACITACCAALCDAGVGMLDYVVSCTAGLGTHPKSYSSNHKNRNPSRDL